MKRIATKVKGLNVKDKVMAATSAASAVATSCIMNVMAFATSTKVTINDKSDASLGDVMGSVVGFMLDALRSVGVAFLAWGIFQFFNALKDENADSKSKAIMVIVAGVGMCLVKSVLKILGFIS